MSKTLLFFVMAVVFTLFLGVHAILYVQYFHDVTLVPSGELVSMIILMIMYMSERIPVRVKLPVIAVAMAVIFMTGNDLPRNLSYLLSVFYDAACLYFSLTVLHHIQVTSKAPAK